VCYKKNVAISFILRRSIEIAFSNVLVGIVAKRVKHCNK
jgi:hypothetical protein